MSAPLRAPHAALGAAFAELGGTTVVRRYADASAEYHAVRTAVGIVERSDLAVLRLWGKDPIRMLNGLITNDLAGAPEGRAVYAAMLTPKGRIISDLRAFRRSSPEGTDVMIEVPVAALEAVTGHLRKFVPPLFARFEDVSASVGALGVYGPRAPELLGRVFARSVGTGSEDDLLELAFGREPVAAIATRIAGEEPGYDLFVPVSALAPLWNSLLAQGADLGVRPIGFGALETLRVEAGRPRYGHELTDETIPTEAYQSTGLMERAISFSKGCYTGQEVIIRIAHRGHVNRHLRGLLLGDLPTPPDRTPLFHPESHKEVGWTTTSALSPRVRQTVALAFVRRELGPGSAVRLGAPDGSSATVTRLPFENL